MRTVPVAGHRTLPVPPQAQHHDPGEEFTFEGIDAQENRQLRHINQPGVVQTRFAEKFQCRRVIADCEKTEPVASTGGTALAGVGPF
jgi:hypothetical protein